MASATHPTAQRSMSRGRRRRRRLRRRLLLLTTLAAALSTTPGEWAAAAPPEAHAGADIAVNGHIFEPADLPPPNVAALKVPPGFKIEKFAEKLGNARILAVADDGTVYVTRREEGDVLMLKDVDGRAGGPPVRVASRSGLHGISLHAGKVYLATPKEIFRGPVLPDGRFGPLEMLIHDLPDAGQHNTRTVQIGPDDMMYISVGSTCNECLDTNPENATILRASLDGKTRAIFASGLRDTVGWGWHPRTGELWGMDQGIDWLGDDLPPEELNHIEKGKRYGWPHVWGDNQVNPHNRDVGGVGTAEWLAESTPMVLGYTAHAAPMQLAFYTGSQFPPSFQGDAFVSMRGSWNRKPPRGYEVVRIRFKDGQAVAMEPFVSGFLVPGGQSARLCGMAVARDGALLFTDDRNGVIYRVSYAATAPGGATGTATTRARPASSATSPAGARPPAGSMKQQIAQGSGVPLAVRRSETVTSGRLTVTSTAFRDGASIPPLFSDYEQGASFPVQWTAGPAATRSYVLIMEDPDGKGPPTPVVHWVAWNIPPDVTSLREGLQKQDRLEDPPGLRQGPTSSGAIGYRGPRPPAGDPPHHYHVQLFAVDRALDLTAGADRDQVLTAIKGHVLARGELVGTLKRPDRPSKP
jgi:Raf kinase inhibitor-like YbhB/YbcL family protein